jgi:ribosomal protein S14
MHDPLTVAFEIRRPWPETADWRTKQAARDGIRWRFNSPFWVLAGRGLYFPSLITIWHRDPSGYDHTTCTRRGWKFHVHHWRLQVHPFQHLRRRLLTRCAWCGGRSAKGDSVCVSHTWDGPRARWWRGEPGLFHADCSAIKSAHSTCACETPALDSRNYGRCAVCGRFRPISFTDANLARVRELQSVPQGGRRDSARETPIHEGDTP